MKCLAEGSKLDGEYEMIYAIAVLKTDKCVVGARLLDTETGHTKDVSMDSLAKGIKAGIKVRDIQINDCRAVFIPGEDAYICVEIGTKNPNKDSRQYLLYTEGLQYITADADGRMHRYEEYEAVYLASAGMISNADVRLSEKNNAVALKEYCYKYTEKTIEEAADAAKLKAELAGGTVYDVADDGRLLEIYNISSDEIRIPSYVREIYEGALRNTAFVKLSALYTGINASHINGQNIAALAYRNNDIGKIVIQNAGLIYALLDTKLMCEAVEIDIELKYLNGERCMGILISAFQGLFKVRLRAWLTWESLEEKALAYIKGRISEAVKKRKSFYHAHVKDEQVPHESRQKALQSLLDCLHDIHNELDGVQIYRCSEEREVKGIIEDVNALQAVTMLTKKIKRGIENNGRQHAEGISEECMQHIFNSFSPLTTLKELKGHSVFISIGKLKYAYTHINNAYRERELKEETVRVMAGEDGECCLVIETTKEISMKSKGISREVMSDYRRNAKSIHVLKKIDRGFSKTVYTPESFKKYIKYMYRQ